MGEVPLYSPRASQVMSPDTLNRSPDTLISPGTLIRSPDILIKPDTLIKSPDTLINPDTLIRVSSQGIRSPLRVSTVGTLWVPRL
jgi:hypothetical protein